MKVKTIFDDGEGMSGKTKTKATAKETDRTKKKDLSAVSALTEVGSVATMLLIGELLLQNCYFKKLQLNVFWLN